MLLTGTSDLVRVTTSSTADIDVQASYVDITTALMTPLRTNTKITSATTTTIVGSPAASTQRQVKTIVIRNIHAATANTVTVLHTDGTTSVIVWSGVLSASESVLYTGNEWITYDANGDVIQNSAGLQLTSEKDASGGYVGLTLQKINFWNAAKTFLSFFTNANSAARTYTFQDRDGTIADDTNLALKANLASPVFSGKATLSAHDIIPATYTPGTGSATVALDVSTTNMHEVTCPAGASNMTFTITGATNSQLFTVAITQGATTPSTIVAWFATVRWPASTTPTLTPTINKRDTFIFRRTGAATYDGWVVGANH